MDRKVEYLQESLEKSQKEIRERDQKVSGSVKLLQVDILFMRTDNDEVLMRCVQVQFLTERLEMLKSQLQVKEELEKVWLITKTTGRGEFYFVKDC